MGYTSEYAQKMMSGDKLPVPSARKKAKDSTKHVALNEGDRIAARNADIKKMSKNNPNNPNY